MGQVYIIETIPNQEQMNQIILFVSKERQKRMRVPQTSSEFAGLLGEALVLGIGRQKAICESQEIHFLRNDYGKPYIPELPMFHFNISHSNHFLAIALSEYPVGVDIEQFKPTDLRIAKRFFSLEEQTYVFSCPQKQFNRFYEIWTQKEAYVKYIGCGFCKPLADINVCDSKITGHMLTYFTGTCCTTVFRHNTNEKFEIHELSYSTIPQLMEAITKITTSKETHHNE